MNAVFFRLAGTFKLRGKAGESSVKKVFCCFLLGNLVVSLTCIQLCSLQNVPSKTDWVPQALFYPLILIIARLSLIFLTVPAFCYYADIGAIVSSKVYVYYPCLSHFQLFTCLMTAKEDSPAYLSLHDSLFAASKI